MPMEYKLRPNHTRLPSTPLYGVTERLARTMMHLSGVETHVSGEDNLLTDEPFMLALTHFNSWDGPAVGSSVYQSLRKPVYFFMTERYLRSPLARSYWQAIGAIAIDPDKNDLDPIRRGVSILNNRGILASAPQAGRVNGFELGRLHPTTMLSAILANVSIVPATAIGRQDLHPWMPRHLVVGFGEPLQPAGLAENQRQIEGDSLRHIPAAARRMAKEVTAELAQRWKPLVRKALQEFSDRFPGEPLRPGKPVRRPKAKT